MQEVIVVGTMNLGESDRLVRLLSAHHGRLSAVARRARSSKRRFAGLLDVGTRLEIELRTRRSGLPSLIGAELVRSPARARERLESLTMMAYGCEVISALAPEQASAPKLFRLLTVLLEQLESGVPSAATRGALEVKALTFAGLTPALVSCPVCGEVLVDPVSFNADLGGGIHAHCGGGAPITLRELHLYEALRRTPLAKTFGATHSVSWLMSDFIQHQLGRALKSRGMLQTVFDTTS